MNTRTQNQPDTATPPASRWRNKYWLATAVVIAGELRGPGEVWSKYVWPSEDIAISKALNSHEERIRSGIDCEYLGAFPIEN